MSRSDGVESKASKRGLSEASRKALMDDIRELPDLARKRWKRHDTAILGNPSKTQPR